MRAFDIFFSFVFLLVLFPALLLICFFLRLSGEGEVFFSQLRIGLNGKAFYVYKFATMLKNSPNMGTKTLTTLDDSRILPFGKFLRKTKLNEIPQLFNILNGDMSIVGPRPLTEQSRIFYSKRALNKINKLKPGLTGLGSLFFRHEELMLSNNPNLAMNVYQKKISPIKSELEIWYFSNRNFSLDIKIIFLTILLIFVKKNNLIFKLIPNLPAITYSLKS
ncbi:WcaJ Sugar transferases involved in lipopolysaccharide synthesis [Candidatus Methylopumilus planktonicus]|uniref:sugar transferase n=1 Tax=Candidatus Methylopumilus planktonicus TaxID=1581557 RepID=UPI003BEF17F1